MPGQGRGPARIPAPVRARLSFALLLAASVAAADQTVTIGPGLSFVPSSVTVVPGEKVTWTWAGTPHSTTSDATTGPEVWDSGVQFVIGTTFSHTFTTPGTYPYYCRVHSFPGGTMMNGVVQVVAATATPTPSATPTVTLSPSPTPVPSAPTPTASPVPPSSTPTPAGAGVAVPDLGLGGRALLALGLALAALLLLNAARTR